MRTSLIHSNNLEPHELAVHEFGQPSSNAIILLHAFTHNGQFFSELAQYLCDTGLYVVCPDMPGRGQSSYLENSRNYNYKLYVDDLFLILKTLKIENAALFGNSMGGILSVLFTEKYPAMVSKIILNDIGVVASSVESMRIGRHVGNSFVKKNKGEMIQRLDEEFLQSNLTNAQLEFIFTNYVHKIDDGFTFNYDIKLRDAFWLRQRQIKIPDLDFSENFGYLAKTCKNLELYVIRGSQSNLLDKLNYHRLTACRQHKGSFEVPNKGHLPLFFNQQESEIILKWLQPSHS